MVLFSPSQYYRQVKDGIFSAVLFFLAHRNLPSNLRKDVHSTAVSALLFLTKKKKSEKKKKKKKKKKKNKRMVNRKQTTKKHQRTSPF